jgi:hypothetical protein
MGAGSSIGRLASASMRAIIRSTSSGEPDLITRASIEHMFESLRTGGSSGAYVAAVPLLSSRREGSSCSDIPDVPASVVQRGPRGRAGCARRLLLGVRQCRQIGYRCIIRPPSRAPCDQGRGSDRCRFVLRPAALQSRSTCRSGRPFRARTTRESPPRSWTLLRTAGARRRLPR